ncbi:MAG: hypothetical protein QNK04_19430 [Myxococcota bacterium]|nr:hypothetical protein [Myxococcota bacterium]
MSRATRRVAAVLGSIAVAGGAAGAPSGPPPCRVSLELEPDEAFVDQQVIHRLRIEARPEVRRVDWLVPPAFPGLRSERLAGVPDAGEVTRDGVGYRVREERTALFPERAGTLDLPEASLRCTAAFDVLDVLVPRASLRVRALPEAGRPDDFAGLVGRVELIRRVEPAAGAVGSSLRLTVRMRGDGNLWDAPDPHADDADFAGAEAFRLPPKQDLDRAARLRTGRLFAYDLVPTRPGHLALPELRVPWFDPSENRYEIARAPAIGVEVAAAPAAAGVAPRASNARDDPTPDAGTARPAAAMPRWIAATVVTLVAVGALFFVVQRRRRRSGAGLPEGDDPAALGRALRAALARHVPGAERQAPEELLASGPLPPAAHAAATLLAALERARFDPEARRPARSQVERSIEALRGARR